MPFWRRTHRGGRAAATRVPDRPYFAALTVVIPEPDEPLVIGRVLAHAAALGWEPMTADPGDTGSGP